MKNKKTIKEVFSYIGRYKALLFLSFLIAISTVVLTLYLPIIFGRAIDLLTKNIDLNKIFEILVKATIIVIATALLQWSLSTLSRKISYRVVKDIRNTAFNKIQTLPLSYLDLHSVGDIVSRVIADAEQFSDGLFLGFTSIFTGIATLLIIVFFMLKIDISTTIVVIFLTPLSLFIAKFIAKRTQAMFRMQSEIRAEQTAFINEMIGGFDVIKAYGRENFVIDDFDVINEKMGKASLKATFFSSILNPSTRFINNIVYAGVALVGAFQTISGCMTVGSLATFLAYVGLYTKPFNEISGVITELQNAIVCAGRLLDFINEKDEPCEGDVKLEEKIEEVKLENISFSYDKNKEFMKNLNIDVKCGQKIAIVGPTGCGKTTLINLLMRFYDVDAGKITINNKDIRNITRNSLRRSYGMVLQDTWLKRGTIRENITFGKPDATEKEIIRAAKAAHSHSFIVKLKDGYDTVIDKANCLSKGQMQLLCITRVMLLSPSILILDEATSSIDTMTEIKIQKAFEDLMRGRTSFIVAHRLSTIKGADIILVMKDGNIIERGSHNDLIKNNGFYAELYNSRFAE